MEKEQFLWDKSALAYQRLKLPRELYNHPLEELKKQVFWRKLLKHAKGLALEAGCGTGKNSLVLTKQRIIPVLLDFSETAIKSCKEMFETFNKEALFIVGDMRHMPFKDETFDFIHTDSTIEHIPECKEAIKEIERITKKGEYVFATVPNKLRLDGVEMWKRIVKPNYTQRSYTPNELKDLFKETRMGVEELFGYDILSPTWSLILRKIQQAFRLEAFKNQEPITASIAREEGGQGFLEQIILGLLNKIVFSRKTIYRFITSKHNSLVSINLAIILKK